MTLDSTHSPQQISTEEPDLDAESLNAIRSILTEEDAPKPARRFGREPVIDDQKVPQEVAPLRRKADDLPPLSSADAASEKVAAPAKKRFSLRRKHEAVEQRHPEPRMAPAAAREPVQPSVEAAEEGGWMQRIKAYRPKPVHIALGAFALLVLTRPWLVFGVAVLFAIIFVGVFLIVGYDGFWKGVMKLGRWYAKRNPERAVLVNKRLDAFAMRWDAILDRFPEGSVDSLYLPDFGDLANADKRHEEAVDRRLAGLAEKPS